MLICVLLPILYWVFEAFWSEPLFPEDHPFRAVLIAGLLYAAVASTVLVSVRGSLWSSTLHIGRKHFLTWVFPIGLFLGTIASFFAESMGFTPGAMGTLVIAGGIILVVIFGVSMFIKTVGQVDEHVRIGVWGHFISLVVMILAMFAFGLKQEDGKLHVHWQEVPAILIVFVLVETGVALVVRAQETSDRMDTAVREMSGAISSVADAKKKVELATEGVGDATRDLIEVGKKISLLQSSLPVKTVAFSKQTEEEEKDVGEHLATFLSSWLPSSPDSTVQGNGPGLLISKLFGLYIGETPEDGMVRSLHGNRISCITVGSLFAELSRVWLSAILDRYGRGVEVHAVSALLPTEFAASTFFETDDGRRTRVKELEQFVDLVAKLCNSNGVYSYKRITVLGRQNVPGVRPEGPKIRQIVDGWNVSKETDCLCKESLSLALDQWFVVPSVSDLGVVASKLLSQNGTIVEVGEKEIWDVLKSIDTSPPGYMGYVDSCRTHRVLPILPGNHDNMVLGFRSRHQQRGLLYIPKKTLDSTLTDLDRWHYTGTGVEGNLTSTSTVREGLRMSDCLSIRDWYCGKLHKAPGQGVKVAVWATAELPVVRKIVDKLKIEWGEETNPSWWPADLLLISVRDSQGDRSHPIGAVVSNFSLDNPECVIQLILDSLTLTSLREWIEEAVGMCYGSSQCEWADFGKAAGLGGAEATLPQFLR